MSTAPGLPSAETPAPSPAAPRRRVAWPLLAVLVAAVGIGLMSALQAPAVPTSSPAARPGPDDLVIVAGIRVGFITLGLPVNQVESRWGKGLIRPTEDALVYTYEDRGVALSVQHDAVVSILVKNPQFHTRGGVAVGGDVSEAIREFGKRYEYESKPITAYRLAYWDQGIHLGVEKTTITSIQITQPVLDSIPPRR